MPESLHEEISALRDLFWSARDPEGRAFAPLADACRRQGDLDEAFLLIQDGLGRHPDFATGQLIAARVARDRGDMVAALKHLDHVIELDGGNVVALIERSDAAAAEGDREGALEALQRASQLDPDDLQVSRRLDALKQSAAWEADEVPVVEEAEIPDPEAPIYTRTMGDLYARQGFRERAIEVYEHLQEEEPEDHEIAERLDELRRPAEAQPAFEDSEDTGADAQSVAEETELVAADPASLDDGSEAAGGEEEFFTADVETLDTAEHLETAYDEPTSLHVEERDAEAWDAEERDAEDGDAEEAPLQEDADPTEDADSDGAADVDEREPEVELAVGPAESDDQASDMAEAPEVEADATIQADGTLLEADDSAGAPVGAEAPDEPATETRPISGYFEDLLAWAPGAVPIEVLAPGYEGDEIIVPIKDREPDSAMGSAFEGANPVADESADSEEDGGSESDAELDDFRRWLKGLQK